VKKPIPRPRTKQAPHFTWKLSWDTSRPALGCSASGAGGRQPGRSAGAAVPTEGERDVIHNAP